MRKRIISLVLVLLLFAGICPLDAQAATMTYSDALVTYIKYGEGFSPTLYQDAGGWCIGYGCIVNPDDYPDGISEEDAEALLREKMNSFADDVKKFLSRYGLSVTQGQFDAMCSMTYNLGPYWLSAANTLPSMIINGVWNYSDEDVVSAFAAWCHVGGNVSKGLLTRRIAEAKMFLYGDYSGSSAGWSWLVCSGNGGSVTRKVNCYRTGGTYGSMPTATRSGYILEGWETESGAVLTSGSTVSGNYFVSAKWRSESEATPAPTPEVIPEPTPTPAPETNPAPVATPTPTPEAPAQPAPTSTPTPVPEATPAPTPAPTPVPETKPASTPAPTAAPTPTPTAAPTPTATPTPSPSPTPEAEEELKAVELDYDDPDYELSWKLTASALVVDGEEEWENTFSDLRLDAWYYEYVADLAEAGVISGYPDGSFRPGNFVTWGEALKTMTIATGFPTIESGEDEEEAEKTEEESGHWAQAYLEFALEKGFLESGEGIELDEFISREETAELLASFLELEAEEEMKNPFKDSSNSAVLALYHIGIVDGSLEEGRRYFKGEDNIKRSELSKLLSLGKAYVAENFICIMGDRAKINFDLPMNELDESRFISYKDRIYYDDSSMDIRYGVDVSQHQYDIDWKALAADGFDYAIIRIGYRGYTEGKMSIDPYFEENMKEAAEAGLDIGVYFFSQATSVEEALEEAEFVLDAIEGYEINYPVVFDWEPMFVYGSRTLTYDGDIVTDASIAFMNRIAEAGYTPMTYYNKSIAYLKLDLAKLDGYPVWLAQYATEAPDYIYHFDMWQYGTAQVDGVEGECDVNISFRDFAKTGEEAH